MVKEVYNDWQKEAPKTDTKINEHTQLEKKRNIYP